MLICLFLLQKTFGPPWDSLGLLGALWELLGAPLGLPWDPLGHLLDPKVIILVRKLGNFENLWKPSGTFEDLRGPSGTFGNPLKPSETAKKIKKHWQIKISRFGQKQKMRNSELGTNL